MAHKYEEYHNLTDYQKRCLPVSNYWRVMNLEPIIEVPETDTNYHENFDKRCYELVEDYQELKNRK